MVKTAFSVGVKDGIFCGGQRRHFLWGSKTAFTVWDKDGIFCGGQRRHFLWGSKTAFSVVVKDGIFCRGQRRHFLWRSNTSFSVGIKDGIFCGGQRIQDILGRTFPLSEWHATRAGNSLIRSPLICSFCSNQMSDYEQFAQIAQIDLLMVAQRKWATMSKLLRSLNRERLAQVAQRKWANERFAQQIWLKKSKILFLVCFI